MSEKYRIQYTKKYFEDYLSIILYFRNQLKLNKAVDNFKRREYECVKNIKTMPNAYKKLSKKINNQDIRRAQFNNFTIFYSIKGSLISLRRIVYSKRDFDNLYL